MVVFAFVLLAAGCVRERADPILESTTIVAGGKSIQLNVQLQPEHARSGGQITRAAAATLQVGEASLGPPAFDTLTLIDPAWHAESRASPGTVMLDRTPWWNARATMSPELAAARGVSRRIWRDAFATAALPQWFVDGLAEYTVRRVVAPLFQGDQNPPGYSFLELRYFGGFVPRFVRIRLLAESDGDPLSAYRRHPRDELNGLHPSPDDLLRLTAKTVLAIGSLERWVGRPVLDHVISRFAAAARERVVTLEDFEQLSSEVSGEDLTWFFEESIESTKVFDYAVDRIVSEPTQDGMFLSRVLVRRIGDGVFSGRTAPRVGPFESGRGVAIRVSFASGEPLTDHWDGRDADKQFVYRSTSPIVSAEIDPDRVILLDVNRSNNSVSAHPRGSAAASRWAVTYMQWLSDLLMGYAALV